MKKALLMLTDMIKLNTLDAKFVANIMMNGRWKYVKNIRHVGELAVENVL